MVDFDNFSDILNWFCREDSDSEKELGSDFQIEIWFDYDLVWNLRSSQFNCLSLAPAHQPPIKVQF